ncbi:hypothetical protein KSZ_47530 [Dictyobacter formicarum]|uniref:Uncharacterized protein n=1 Tax=Dictyobacter formicarum TaxID=2778368 RepID=A0ABQ3VKM0_9CHLR|nr:hypothetical protein KSZ_47530 [Dictyobacter formicarum]
MLMAILAETRQCYATLGLGAGAQTFRTTPVTSLELLRLLKKVDAEVPRAGNQKNNSHSTPQRKYAIIRSWLQQ